jgi:tetratricopeptide (TPR) repeat protein
LLRVVDAGLASVMLLVPWFLGGRHPVGELVLVIVALTVALAWSARACCAARPLAWRRSPADWLVPAAAALLLLQLVPWPRPVLLLLSPQLDALLPLWTPGGESPARLGEWTQVSLSPSATRGALVLVLAYGCLFWVAVQRLQTLADVERLLRWMAWSAVALAGVGLAQYLVGNGKFLWIYEHPYRRVDDAVKGPLTNRNHFAHLLALQLGAVLWLLLAVQRRGAAAAGFAAPRPAWHLPAVLGGLGLVLFAGLLSLSRGGAVAMLLATGVALAVLYRADLVSRRFLASMAAAFAVIAVALVIHGLQGVSHRLDDLTTASWEDLDGQGYRRQLWAADFRSLDDFARLGAGAGSHVEVYPLYLREPWSVECTHAECGYLQVAMETGLPGLALLLAGLALCGRWCWRACRHGASRGAVAAAAAVSGGLAASAAHSLADFVWYIPACMAIAIVLAAAACRLAELTQLQARDGEGARAVPRWAVLAGTVVLAVVGSWMTYDRWCAAAAGLCWDDYLRYAHSPAVRQSAPVPDQAVIDNLRRLVAWTPDDARAQQRLATALLQRFNHQQQFAENAMPLNQVRDAALQSAFASRAELDRWLSLAVGPHRADLDRALEHAHQAVRAGPLSGEAYALLAELCFLEGRGPDGKRDLVRQAVLVRPYEGAVLMAAGGEAMLAGDRPAGLAYWKKALRCELKTQRALVELFLAAGLPSAEVVGLFQPALPATRLIHSRYQQSEPAPAQQTLLRYYARQVAAQASQPAADAGLWLELQEIYRQLQEPQRRIAALQQGLRADPNLYDARFLLSMCLFDEGRWSECQPHLEWCLQRRPHDEALRAKHLALARELAGAAGRTAAGPAAPRH